MNLKDIQEYGYHIEDHNLVIKHNSIPKKYIDTEISLAENIERWLDVEC